MPKSPPTKDPFFLGWGKIPKDLKLFLLSFAISIIAFFSFAAYLISATQDDPGDARFIGRANAIGVLQTAPYPMLHVMQSDKFKPGDTVILSGNGKRGVIERTAALDGQVVQIGGAGMKRGDLLGMQLRGGKNGLRKSDRKQGEFQIEAENLGRWRLSGEICDGKCLAGAMRPGTGLAHRACANLCLEGGVAPVFVSSTPVEGEEFLLMGRADGRGVTEEIQGFTAKFVEIEGMIERRGSILVFNIEPETIRSIE